MSKHKLVKIRVDDDERLMSSVKEMFLKKHPEYKALPNISRAFLIRKTINFYLNERFDA